MLVFMMLTQGRRCYWEDVKDEDVIRCIFYVGVVGHSEETDVKLSAGMT